MLKDILAISGQPGLYKMISNTKNGIIVENLENQKRMPAYTTAKISALDDIAIYTQDGEDKPLIEIYKILKEKTKGEPSIDHKASSNELTAYFSEIMPDYDRERVYVSDIKKVFQWFNILQKLDMLHLVDEPAEDEKETETEKEPEKKEVTPKPKKTKKSE